MAKFETLNKLSVNALIARAEKMHGYTPICESKNDLVSEFFARENAPMIGELIDLKREFDAENVESADIEIPFDYAPHEMVVMNDNLMGNEEVTAVNEISESGELGAHNVERHISSMKTCRAAVRKMIDASLINAEFSRTLTTVLTELPVTVKFDKANKGAPFMFAAGAFETNDQRAFYAFLKKALNLPAK